MNMLTIRNYLLHPRLLGIVLLEHFGTWLPDKTYIKALYYLWMRRPLDLNNPQTFCEKIQWLKLYYRKPDYTTLVDKYLVKDYVSSIIGKEYVIPTISVWNSAKEIDWGSLPDQFVLKTTHGGGSSGVIVCKDKSLFNPEEACKKLNSSMKQDIYRELKEWPYKNVNRKIIAEEYISSGRELADYKWYCFDGEPKYCQVIQDRHSHETIDFFDTNWNHMDFIGLNPRVKHADTVPMRPNMLELQISIARKLSTGIPFVRVDLYEVNNCVFFGEITLYPSSGLGSFNPPEYDYYLGTLLRLPIPSQIN